MNKLSNFGERLNELIIENHIDFIQLCTAIELPKMTIYRYISNKRKPTLENALKLVNYFNSSLDLLLGLTDENKSKKYLSAFFGTITKNTKTV